MKKSVSTIAAAFLFAAGIGLASAQTTTTTTTQQWTNDQGKAFSEYSTTQKYNSYSEPTWKPTVGAVLPDKATLYSLPDTMKVPSADTYRYSMINGHPVVVESTSRKVIHSWE